jgi:hypothetical protein
LIIGWPLSCHYPEKPAFINPVSLAPDKGKGGKVKREGEASLLTTGLKIVMVFSTVMCLIAAAASWLRSSSDD